jgi:hypothetical protein|tara:strand:- start:189 stop:1043 length:855 start_codon:yes stop_codon:yes gene_type:complete
MSNKFYLVADFFYEDFTGGAELNDFSLLRQFKERGILVEEVYSKDVTPQFLSDNLKANFIVANFVALPPHSKQYMMENNQYVIYEHDHKYLQKRNPIFYKDFTAPKNELANIEFFAAAKATVCLTQLALDVFKRNTGLENVDKIGASVWRDEDLDYLVELNAQSEKNGLAAIMDSPNPIKKKFQCIEFCEKKQIPHELISDRDHRNFLKKLSAYEKLVFMTGHLETCCRIIVEAKMLNCEVLTQKALIGACSEDWFKLNGLQLIEEIRKVSKNSVDVFLRHFDE